MSQTKAQLLDGKVATIEFTGGSASTPSITFTGDTNTGLYSPGADQVAISTNGTGRLFVDASGNVGIGTASGGRKLEITGIGTGTTLDGVNISNGTAQGAFLTTGASYTYRGIGSNQIWLNANGTTLQVGTVQSHPLIFSTNSFEVARFDTSGRLGLGTSTPGARAEIFTSGTLNLRLNGDLIGGNTVDFYNFIPGVANAGFAVQLAGTTRAVIDSSGRVGIGTASPGNALHVVGNIQVGSTSDTIYSSNFGNYSSASDLSLISGSASLLFKTGASNTERMRIDTSGRLLVGTSSSISGAPLEVVGTGDGIGVFRFSSNVSDECNITLFRSKSATPNTNTALANGDAVGRIYFSGANGSGYNRAASIGCEIDGAVSGGGANDMPGRLVFSTTADGASSPTERMRIGNIGFLKASNTGSYTGPSSTYHEFVNSTSNWINALTSTNASPFGLYIAYNGAAPNGSGNEFIYCLDTAAVRMYVRSNGGIGNYSANNVNLSDRNAKKDITPAPGTWDCLKEWEIVNFRYKDQEAGDDLNLGVIAQQVAESCPEVITVFQEAKEATEKHPAQEERLGVKEQQMYWMAIKALQEAQLRIEALEAANLELISRIDSIENSLSA